MRKNFASPLIHPLPGLNMMAKTPEPKVGAIGIHGPWSLNPGSPNFPNHRPYLTHPQAPNPAAAPIAQKPRPV